MAKMQLKKLRKTWFGDCPLRTLFCGEDMVKRPQGQEFNFDI